MTSMLSRLCAYLTYREPFTSGGIEYRYYSIGSCILTVTAVGIVVLTIAATVASFEPQDVVHPVTVVKGTP